MNTFWRTKTGKFIVGGCGTQVGLLLTLGSLMVAVIFCGICLLANVFSISLTQRISAIPPVVTGEPASADDELTLIRTRLELLVDRVGSIQAENLIPPSPTPLPPKPLATARESGVNLRSGPAETYTRLGRLAKGDSLEIVGRNADSTWWLVVTAEGAFAWVADMVVATANVDDSLVVVTIPALLVQPGPNVAAAVPPGAASSPASDLAVPASLPLSGTPIPESGVGRRFVLDTLGYKQLIRGLLLPTVSESFSPDGRLLAITEQIKLYTITADGATTRILLENEDEPITLVGDTVWSPDGLYLVFVADQLQDCDPCRRVGLVRLGDGEISFLEPPPDSALHKPRWTQDGRLLVTAYLDDPAQGRAFLYDTSGRDQPAVGSYRLSSSHAGQKWFPWQPGRSWQVDRAERADGYYGD
jgi:hypothetical protein